MTLVIDTTRQGGQRRTAAKLFLGGHESGLTRRRRKRRCRSPALRQIGSSCSEFRCAFHLRQKRPGAQSELPKPALCY
jgi:hypothetical protein